MLMICFHRHVFIVSLYLKNNSSKFEPTNPPLKNKEQTTSFQTQLWWVIRWHLEPYLKQEGKHRPFKKNHWKRKLNWKVSLCLVMGLIQGNLRSYNLVPKKKLKAWNLLKKTLENNSTRNNHIKILYSSFSFTLNPNL